MWSDDQSVMHLDCWSACNMPGTVQVSPILTDGRMQQRYTEVASSLDKPDGAAAALVRQRPEAQFLKGVIQDMKRLAGANPGKLGTWIAEKPFPDIHFIYTALQRGK